MAPMIRPHASLPSLLAGVVLAGATAALAQGGATTTIRPGYWETTSQVVSPFPTSKTEKRYIRPEDVEKVIAGSPNHNYTCTYPTREIGGGRIRLEGSCKTKHSDPVPISTKGIYTPDSLRLDAYVRTRIGGLPVPVHARTSGKRIADSCPAPTDAK